MRDIGTWVQGQGETGSRKNRRKEPTTWNKGIGQEKDQPKEWEEVPIGGNST